MCEMKTNVKMPAIVERTHGGAVAAKMTDEQALRRSVLANFLWENEFYESGETIASRIKALVPKVAPEKVAALAVEARTDMKLRHVPLFLVREMVRHASHRSLVADTLEKVVERADEMGEFLALYWKDQVGAPLAAQVKKGLRAAFGKFDAYQLAKYDSSKSGVRPRDVMFLTHPKPFDEDVFRKLANKELESPDTWEVALSGGADKTETFTRLLEERKLGALALLRNLRNMQQAGVDETLIRQGLENARLDRVLPFRFITAAKYAPRLEGALEAAMFRCLDGMPKLPGKTVLVIDVSGSMGANLSAKSEMTRMESAFGISVLAREICEDVQIYVTAGSDARRIHQTELVPARRGFGLVDAMRQRYPNLGGGGIFLKQCMDFVYAAEKGADRTIVFTDEQDCDVKANPATANAFGKNNYLVNIASAQNGIVYGDKWLHVNGFSEAVLKYIYEAEKNLNQ